MSVIKNIIFILSILAVSIKVNAGDLFDAIDSAAEKTVNKLTGSRSSSGIKSIAFIGFKNNRDNYASAFNAALNENPGKFSFYTRNSDLINKLVGEIEFGEKKQDIMDAKTIQKFGSITGVQALLVGEILESSSQGKGEYTFKISLILYEVETLREIWGGIITGVSNSPVQLKTVNPEVVKAALDAGRQLNHYLMLDKNNMPKCNIYILPFMGVDGAALTRTIVSELDEHQDGKITVYADTASIDKNSLDDIASQSMGQSPTLSTEALKSISEKLINKYNLNPKAISQGKYSIGKLETYFLGIVESIYFDKAKFTQNVILNVQIREIGSNRVIWSKTVEGSYQLEKPAEPLGPGFFEEHKNMMYAIAGVALLILLLVIFSKYMSRVR